MKIEKFIIKNFKGISSTTIELQSDAPGNITTLIGLNESGKTTILEAISQFVSEDKSTAELVGTVKKKAHIHDIIPKHMKAAFSGTPAITASVLLEDSDLDALEAHFLETHGLKLDRASIPQRMPILKSYKFEDSNLESVTNFWSVTFNLKKPKAKKFTPYEGGDHVSQDAKDIWTSGILLLRDRMPKIVYFPTFLFDFPERIYLKKEISTTNDYYIDVIQDILDSKNENISIEKHVLQRIAKVREQSQSYNFVSNFYQSDERKQIEAVLQKVSNEIGRSVFGSWTQILGRSIVGKRVQINLYLDSDKDHAPYLELLLVDGEVPYSLSERSLGFRWFFSFLLFTEFRRNRANSATIFLFDEPAANLHAKAQMKLLESFDRIAQNRTQIIYSTHSHYMISPLWLEKAYIVENQANDYNDPDGAAELTSINTKITATRYRKFIAQHPQQTTYFQPVLDALDVAISPLLASSKALVIEGKYDYHAIEYFRKNAGVDNDVKIYPANGAGSVGPLVSLFRGWGVDFRILLDGDKAGIEGKKKYKKDYLVTDKELVMLSDISPEMEGKAFESVYDTDVTDAIKEKFAVTVVKKRQFSLFFQELLLTKSKASFPTTEKNFLPIAEWINKTFSG